MPAQPDRSRKQSSAPEATREIARKRPPASLRLGNQEQHEILTHAASALEPQSTAPVAEGVEPVGLAPCTCSKGPAVCPRCRAAALAPLVRRKARPGARNTGRALAAPPALGAGRALSASERGFFEPRLRSDLSQVRLHDDAQASASAHALGASAFTVGRDIAFAAGRVESPKLLAHELAHVVLGHTGLRRQEESDPDRTGDARTGADPDSEETVVPTPARRFSWSVSSSRPDLVVVPADATRAEIALKLYNDGTQTEAFYYVSPSETYGEAGGDTRAIRFYDPSTAPAAVQDAMRNALEVRLPRDAQETIDLLTSGARGEALASRVMRWSQFSKIKDAGGVSYFERFLKKLETYTITTRRRLGGWTLSEKKRNGLEDLMAELSDRPLEMVRKAITLRGGRDVDYTVEDAGPELATGNAVGRWFSAHDDSAIRITIVMRVAASQDRAEAEIRTRSSSFLGPRVVVPAADNFYYGYGVQYDTVPGAAVPGSEEGHFAWYYPGTVLIGAGDFDPTGFELTPSRGFAVYMVGEAINATTAHDASSLYGLDYGALRLATPDERISIFKRILDAGAIGDAAAVALLTRTVLTMSPEQFRAFERRLDKEGLTARLLGTRDSKLRGQLGQLGQAFTMQSLMSSPHGAQAFADPTVLQIGEGDGSTAYIQAQTAAARSHIVPAEVWNPATTVTAHGAIREPGLPGEAEGDVDRTTVTFTHGSFPDAMADVSRWNRRTEAQTRAYLPTELLALETQVKGVRSQRVVSAFEAALLQGDPQGDASGKDMSDWIDTVMLIQAGFGVARLGGAMTRALAATSLRAGLTVLAEELTSQAGKAAVRSIVDFALMQAAHYALANQEELSKTPQGRVFMSLTTAAIAILATRDIGHLVESGLITRLVAAGREALALVSDAARLQIARTIRDFKAAQQAWNSLREAGALEMVTVGGLKVPSPASMTEFGQSFRMAQGRVAGEDLLTSIRAAGGSTKRAESVLGDLESAAGRGRGAATPTQKEAARAYRDVATYAGNLPPGQVDAFLEAVETTLATGRRSAADLAPALRAAVRAGDPVAALADIQWLAQTSLSREAFTVLAAKVGRGSVDLAWLRTTTLPAKDLEYLARDPKTPWNLFRDAARAPNDTALQLRALARLRGASAEMLAGEEAATLVPGWRTSGSQVEMGSSEIDYSLRATDRTGRTRGMEVKGWTRETWKESIEAYPKRTRRGALNDDEKRAVDRMEHMIGQLRDAAAVAKSETPVLVVTRNMRADDLAELHRIVGRRVDRPVEIVFLEESSITQRSGALRSGLGVPGPQ